MDEADFSEDTTYKQQEDLPYDGDLSQMKIYSSYNLTSTKVILPASEEVVLVGGDPQEESAHCEMRWNTTLAETWDKVLDDVHHRPDEGQRSTLASHVVATKGDTSESRISDSPLRHLSKEQFLGGQGVGYDTFPETLTAEGLDTTIFTNIVSCYEKYCLKEQSPEFTDQLSPRRAENSYKPRCSPGAAGENTSPSEKLETAGQSGHQEDPRFLSRTKGSGDKQRRCLGQTPQKQLTEKASSSNQFKYSQSQVHYQFPDFSKVTPKVKIPRNTITNKPLKIASQASFSPRLRNKSTVVQDNLGTMSGSNCVEKQQPEQKWKFIEPSQQTQMEPATPTHQEPLTGESEKCHLKLTSTAQKELFSNSYIFQKISQGKQMCQKLKEQTEQLKTKVQEFSKRIKQDSLCHLQDRRLMTTECAGWLPGLRGSCGSEATGLPRTGLHEATSKELSELALKMKQKIEKRGHKRTNCGKSFSTVHEKTPHQDSPLGSDPGPSFCSDAGAVLQNKCADCGDKMQSSQKVCSKESLREFRYRYDTPGQDDLNHNGGYTFIQSHFSLENKMSSPSCSKSKWIGSQRVNSEPFQEEHDSTAGKHPEAYQTCRPVPSTPSPQLRFLRIPGIQSLCDGNDMKEMESKILNSALDHALKTATILKKTTDQMIKSIAEDLAKAQRWRRQLRYY